MPRPPLHVVRDAFPRRPAFDTAVSHAVLRLVAAGQLPETLRLHRPGPNVAFGRLDALQAGYPAAVRAARERGFEAVERLAGGRAAVYHEDVVGLAHAVRVVDPARGTYDRFAATAALLAGALGSLGVDARVGEVPGEYCRGSYSVNAGGRTKLAGIGQKLLRQAAHMGGVVVAGGADRVRDVLVPVYDALALAWDPTTVGSVEGELPGVGYESVERAIAEAYAERYTLLEVPLDPRAHVLAERLEEEHLTMADTGAPA